jgi:hypothetical protein
MRGVVLPLSAREPPSPSGPRHLGETQCCSPGNVIQYRWAAFAVTLAQLVDKAMARLFVPSIFLPRRLPRVAKAATPALFTHAPTKVYLLFSDIRLEAIGR